MRNTYLTTHSSARLTRGSVNGWRLLLTMVLILLTLLNAGQGLLCMTRDAAHAHHHDAAPSEQNSEPVAEIVQALAAPASANELDRGASAVDCLHCAGMHAPIFAVNFDALAFYVKKLSQTFPALIETMPLYRLSANFRPPIYT
jgi:hypothetical protein